MESKKVNDVLEELFRGIDTMVDTKTVVGDARYIGDTVIIPLVEVSFGMAAGAFDSSVRKKNSERGGVGAKIKPAAVLVIQDGRTRVLQVGKMSPIEKLIDMAPELMDRLKKGGKATDAEKEEILNQAFDED